MDSKNLVSGFEFAIKHKLSVKEMEILALILQKPLTTQEVADMMGANKNTVHQVIKRLKMKQMLKVCSVSSVGAQMYEFYI